MHASSDETLNVSEPPLPWPQIVVAKQTMHLLATTPELWPLLSDTERMNRAIGISAVAFVPIDTPGTAARFLARTRVAGFLLEYEEDPFEWVNEQRFRVIRRMRRGPVKGYRFSVTLSPHHAGSEVQVTLELAPAHPVLTPLARLLGERLVAQIARYIRDGADDALRPGQRGPHRQKIVGAAAEANGQRVAVGVSELQKNGVAERIAEAVGDLLLQGDEVDVTRIRPFEQADRWQTDRREVLTAMLLGVGAGLLELRWSLICPSCLVPATTVETLAEITPPGHCQFCDLTFGVELDRAVEATFIPHAAVRRIDPKPFCIGGPGRTPHVVAQQVAEPRRHVSFDVPQQPGRYRIFARGGAAASVEVEETVTTERCELVLGTDGLMPARLVVAPGARVSIENATSEPLHIKLERITFASAAATAAMVSNVPAFRRSFSKELLKPSTPMKVARVSLLFSDLTGSTALYARIGDAAAFRFVDDHFDVLRRALEPQEGVVVKTMGDAVMASFLASDAAVLAAHAALRSFAEFAASRDYADAVGLKVGLYSGACYVVTANGLLDYFGQTVNLAARLQGLAASGEVVLMKSEYDLLSESTQRLFRIVQQRETAVKGIAEAVRVLHLVPAD